MNNKNQPAFPVSEEVTDRIDQDIKIYTGLTKREWVSGMVLHGLLANPQLINPSTPANTDWRQNISLTAVMITDALLAQLENS